MFRALDVATSVMATVARAGAGFSARFAGKQPERLLELYEFEACPFCRKAREALTSLDLDALVRPCPKGGTRFRPEAVRLGGKAMFPLLVDLNTGTQLYESKDIVSYLFTTYGNGHAPPSLGPLNTASCALAGAFRTNGMRARPSRAPAEPLELWSFEGSPFCRIAREELCALEIPYVLHNVGKGSSKRETFVRRSGKMMVPYLADPNTKKEMFESADIVRYLRETYGLDG
jgi:glutathione S-transferase